MRWFKTKTEAFSSGNGIYIARDIDSSGRKQFGVVADHEALSQVLDEEACVYEIVTNAWREMYDFDGHNLEDEREIIQDFIAHRQRISSQRVFVKSASTSGKVSLHFIIPSSILTQTQMQQRFEQLLSMGLKHSACYDRSIYTRDRLIRTVRSDKCFKGRPFKALSGGDEAMYFVTPPGPPGPPHLDLAKANSAKASRSPFKWGSELEPGVFRLDRLRPSLCTICCRTHDNDNAWIDTRSLTYGCFRSSASAPLDSDRVTLSRSRITSLLRDFAISDADIEQVLSRARSS